MTLPNSKFRFPSSGFQEEILIAMFVSSHGFGAGCSLRRRIRLVAISSNIERVSVFYPKFLIYIYIYIYVIINV